MVGELVMVGIEELKAELRVIVGYCETKSQLIDQCNYYKVRINNKAEFDNVVNSDEVRAACMLLGVTNTDLYGEPSIDNYKADLRERINANYKDENTQYNAVRVCLESYVNGSTVQQQALLDVLTDDDYSYLVDYYKNNTIIQKFIKNSTKKLVLTLMKYKDLEAVKRYISGLNVRCKDDKARQVLKNKLLALCADTSSGISDVVNEAIYTYYADTSTIEIIRGEVKHQDDKNILKSKVFSIDAVKFAPTTINIIAARPGHGKTTALVSVAMDALRQGRKVVFVTTEERRLAIYYRMIRNEIYNQNMMYQDQCDFMSALSSVGVNTYIQNYIKGEIVESKKKFDDLFMASIHNVDMYLGDHTLPNLIIYPTLSLSLQEVLKYMETIPPNWIVCVDYIQRLPKPDAKSGYKTSATRQLEIQDTEKAICDIAQKKNLICIAGAQFGRPVTKRTKWDPEPMSYDSLRESGDIEQDASCIVAINDYYVGGDNTNKDARRFYYQQLKNREGDLDTGLYDLMGQDRDLTNLALAYSNVGDNNRVRNVLDIDTTAQDYVTMSAVQRKDFGGFV